jgi:hypothetical protein
LLDLTRVSFFLSFSVPRPLFSILYSPFSVPPTRPQRVFQRMFAFGFLRCWFFPCGVR